VAASRAEPREKKHGIRASEAARAGQQPNGQIITSMKSEKARTPIKPQLTVRDLKPRKAVFGGASREPIPTPPPAPPVPIPYPNIGK
jgi:hypothetical protein